MSAADYKKYKQKASKPYDPQKEGPQSWRQLQEENQKNYNETTTPEAQASFYERFNIARPYLSSTSAHAWEGPVRSPLMSQKTRTGDQDYWGRSMFDAETTNEAGFESLGDMRAEAQPWYAKLGSGIAKAGVLALTTTLETAGLAYGIGQGIYNARTDAHGDQMNAGEEFLTGLWDNPITNVLNGINNWSEDVLPNYMTQYEQEHPFTFNANFLGDKIIKNLGFMIGAFYGGGIVSKGIGWVGKRAVKAARTAVSAERQGMALAAREITGALSKENTQIVNRITQLDKQLASKEVQGIEREMLENEKKQLIAQARASGVDAEGIATELKAAHLTEAERMERFSQGLDRVRKKAHGTRIATSTIGSFMSALNEGAIEAIQNSDDWANLQRSEVDAAYEKRKQAILETYGDTPMAEEELVKAAQERDKVYDEIEVLKAKMGNADMLFNIPILMASNMFQLGKLYARGFSSSRRMLGSLYSSRRRELGSFWNGYKLAGDLKDGTLHSTKTWKGAVGRAILNSNSEGLEEYLQRAASDGAGNAVSEGLRRYMNSDNGDTKLSADQYISGFAKAIATNLGNPQAWEEYFIGAVSSMIGMPTFGSQTKNAYIGKDKAVGLSGGFVGTISDYMADKKHEEAVAKYLNERAKDPKLQTMYKALRDRLGYDNMLLEAIADDDKEKYKDLEFEQLFKDLNAAASSGHLGEFLALVGFNGQEDYSNEELSAIVKLTSEKVTAEQQKANDEAALERLDQEKAGYQAEIDRLEGRDTEKLDKLMAARDEAATKLDQHIAERDRLLDEEPDNIAAINETEALIRNAQNTVNLLNSSIDLSERQVKRLTEGWEGFRRSADLYAALDQIAKEYEATSKRIQDNAYVDKVEGPFIRDINGQYIGLDTTEEGRETMKAVLKRNTQNLQNAVGQLIKVRDDIDIETDGRLDDKQISTLSFMKAKILDYEARSAEITLDLLSSVENIPERLNIAREGIEDEVKHAQQVLDAAKQELADGERNRLKEQTLGQLRANVETAEKNLAKAKRARNGISNAIKLMEALTTKKETNRRERSSLKTGYYREGSLRRFYESSYGRLYDDIDVDERALNSDEVQALLANPLTAAGLLHVVLSKDSALDHATKERLVDDIKSLVSLANKKKDYNAKLRESIGDPNRINDAFKGEEDKLKAKELDKQAGQLSQRLRSAHSFTELENIIVETQSSGQLLQKAFEKAKAESDESTKKFLNEYEEVSSFYDSFARAATQLPESLANEVIIALNQDWAKILADSSDTNKKELLATTLSDTAEALEKSVGGKKTGAAIKQILQELGQARAATASNSRRTNRGSSSGAASAASPSGSSSSGSSGSSSGGTGGSGSSAGGASAGSGTGSGTGSGGSSGGTGGSTGSNQPADRNDIINEITDAIIDDTSGSVTSISDLPEALRNKIDAFNQYIDDNGGNVDDKITDTTFNNIYEQVIDEQIVDNATELKDFEVEEYESQKSKDMQEQVASTFNGSLLTRYAVYRQLDGSTSNAANRYADFRSYYELKGAQAKAVFDVLLNQKAFDFVDHNYLGYLSQDGTPTVYYLKSTDPAVNTGGENITFLAVEIDDDAEAAIRKGVLNGKRGALDNMNPVTIGGRRFQIIGVLDTASTAPQDVQDAHNRMQQLLNEELSDKITEAAQEGEPFVLSEKYTNEISDVYTGRLEVRKEEGAPQEVVSLYDLMTYSEAGDASNPADGGIQASAEWSSGQEVVFGFNINGSLIVTDQSALDNAETPNSSWLNMEKHNGAILMFIPKADGRLYPIRCIRATVGEWMDGKVDGLHTWEQMLEGVVDGSIQNSFIEGIVKQLQTLWDDRSSFASKMEAKAALSKFFAFGKTSPVHVGDASENFTLRFSGKSEIDFDESADFITKAKQFFNALKDNDVKFSLPAPNTRGVDSISGRDVVTSGALSVGLRSYYSFNASFTIRPTDNDGKPVETVIQGAGPSFTGATHLRPEAREYDFGEGPKRYLIRSEGGTATVTYEDGSTPSVQEQNMVMLAEQAQNGELPSIAQYIAQGADESAKAAEATKFLEAHPEYNGVYFFVANDGTSDVVWVYDTRKPTTSRLYKYENSNLKTELFGTKKNPGKYRKFQEKQLKEAVKALGREGTEEKKAASEPEAKVDTNKISFDETTGQWTGFPEGVTPQWVDSKVKNDDDVVVDISHWEVHINGVKVYVGTDGSLNFLLHDVLDNGDDKAAMAKLMDESLIQETDPGTLYNALFVELTSYAAAQSLIEQLQSKAGKPVVVGGRTDGNEGNRQSSVLVNKNSLDEVGDSDGELGKALNAAKRRRAPAAKKLFSILKKLEENGYINLTDSSIVTEVKDLLNISSNKERDAKIAQFETDKKCR